MNKHILGSDLAKVDAHEITPQEYDELPEIDEVFIARGRKSKTLLRNAEMPTYVCKVPTGILSDQQKSDIALAISRAHSEATGAPTYFVQVVIDENPTTRFLGGERADGQIWIRGDIRAGRPEKVREALMLEIMRAVASIAHVKESDIWVYLCNLAPTDMVEYGHVLPSPGQEQAWFDGLPRELQNYLSSLGTNRNTFNL